MNGAMTRSDGANNGRVRLRLALGGGAADFLAGALLTPIVLGVGLWRVHALPWWAAVGLVVWLAAAFVGSEATLAALVNLALLLPFASVARRLSEPSATHQQRRTQSRRCEVHGATWPSKRRPPPSTGDVRRENAVTAEHCARACL
jgi:hypothetical protein